MQFVTVLGNGHASDLIAPGFTDARALRRSSLDSPTTMGPFSTSPKAGFPLALGHRRRIASCRQLPSASKRSSLRESVRTKPGCPDSGGRCSPGFLPL
jgi:hypothetical protein